jgi:hypothetical protein
MVAADVQEKECYLRLECLEQDINNNKMLLDKKLMK